MLTELRLWRNPLSRRERIQKRERIYEVPDPTPVELPLNYQRPPSMAEQIQHFVRQEISAQASIQGLGTFHEEDDFDVDDADAFPMGCYDVIDIKMSDPLDDGDASPPEAAEAVSEDSAPPEPSPETEAPMPDEKPQ